MKEIQPFSLAGCLQLPASKSVFQRALLLSACADGTSILRNPTWSNDALACFKAVENLGVQTNQDGNELQLEGLSAFPATCAIHLGESGLAFRMFAGFLSCMPIEATLSAEGSLLNRPLQPIIDSLSSLGIKAENRFPFLLKGKEPAKEIHLDGSFSSQFITGVILALATKEGQHILHLNNPKSMPYIQLSLNMIEQFGAQVTPLSETSFAIEGKQKLTAQCLSLEADWSAASNFITTASLRGSIELKGLNPNSFQADKAIVKLLEEAGASFTLNEHTFKIEEQVLPNFDFNAEHCPDLFPALVLMAAGIPGKSRIKGTNRLVHKESNRLTALMENFAKQGLQISQEENAFIIKGTELKGAKLDSFNDHRMAMIAAMSAAFTKSPVQIAGAAAVNKSYPDFFEDLARVSRPFIKQF